MSVIQLKDVWEMYRLKFIIDGKVSWEDFWALREISFSVEKGEIVGIIGENGSGKSTVLKLISGMLSPDQGEIKVSGKVSGLLELGAGFQPELTGKENVYLQSEFFGLSKELINQRYKEIVEFAEIGKFINAPAKCFSQGMFVRLAFAIAIHMDPDILLIDDTLSVGDEYFQRKCTKKIFELKEQGRTIIIVTHDISALSRLSKRAIFLKEGKIVRDGPIDKVIPLYSQMSGAPEGVGVLAKGNLSLVFNNGRLFLNWKNKLITSDSGGYSTLFINDKWHSSLQAQWEVKLGPGDKLTAIGTFYQLALIQVWQLEIGDNYQIKWSIGIDLKEPVEFQEGCINIILIDEYLKWFTPMEKGKFPLIGGEDKIWLPLLEGNILASCLGVEADEGRDSAIPALIFKQSNYSSAVSGQIFNSDYLSRSRVLQYNMRGLGGYSATRANSFELFSGEIILGTPDIEGFLQSLQDNFVLKSGKIKLIFNKGSCIFMHKGTTITKSSHIHTSFYANGRWYFSSSAHWEIIKHGQNKIILKGQWPNLSITQNWEVELTGEESFLWKVSMEVNAEVEIEQQYFYFLLSGEYTRWFTEYGEGEFPSGFFETEIDMTQRCISDGAVGLISQNAAFPTVSIKFSNDMHSYTKILNSDFFAKSRILRVEKIEQEDKFKFLAGEHKCFKIDVSLSSAKPAYEGNINTLQEKGLRVIFNNGSGRIFWEGKELTKRLGLYTSLRSNSRWHDSMSSAVWKVKKINNGEIDAVGKWLYLPLSQRWNIKIAEGRIIRFEVSLTVDETIEIESLQANLMVSEMYSQWANAGERHDFPQFKDSINDDWDAVFSERAGKCVGVAATAKDNYMLPSIAFIPKDRNQDYHLRVVNSDVYHRGRVLQYLVPGKILKPETGCLFFSGELIVNDEYV